jgi:predicted HAD superfamily hydrolase
MINSFDIFDTIVGRLCFTGLNLFEIIEKNLNIPNFKNIRQTCETKGIDDIYINVKNYYNDDSIDWEKIKQYELELEYELSFPINKYLNIVEQNDILVSDMYLEESIIRNMINKHKLLNNQINFI